MIIVLHFDKQTNHLNKIATIQPTDINTYIMNRMDEDTANPNRDDLTTFIMLDLNGLNYTESQSMAIHTYIESNPKSSSVTKLIASVRTLSSDEEVDTNKIASMIANLIDDILIDQMLVSLNH